MSEAGERVTLTAFLAGLGTAEATEARLAAAEIDRLARIGDAMEGFERRLLPFAIIGAVLFAVGLWSLLWSGYSAGWWITALLGALPLVILVYAVRIAPRTRADNRADALNREHFLPHGGLYFPPGEQPAAVMRVNWTPPEPEPPITEAPRDPRKRATRARQGRGRPGRQRRD